MRLQIGVSRYLVSWSLVHVSTKNISAFFRLPMFYKKLRLGPSVTFCDFEYPKFVSLLTVHFFFVSPRKQKNAGKFTENAVKAIKFCFYIALMLEFSVFKAFKYQNIRFRYSTSTCSFRRIRQIISWFPRRYINGCMTACHSSSPALVRNFLVSILLVFSQK